MNNNSNTNSDMKKEPSKFNGNVNQAAGTVKEAAGKVLNNDKMRAEGAVQTADGKTEKLVAGFNEKLKAGAQVAGDAIERVGEKLTQAGFEKAGAAVHKAGDKIEHSRD